MGNTHIVSINGRRYDPHTGLPVDVLEAAEKTKAHVRDHATVPAQTVHATQQKSTTLNRRTVKKKTTAPKTTGRRSMDIMATPRQRQVVAKSPAISRFAQNPTFKQQVHDTDVQPVVHPLVQKAHAAQTVRPTAPQQHHNAQTKKQSVVTKALAEAKPVKAKKTSLKKRFPRLISVASASLAVLLIAGYLTYLNMPTISIRVAAAQSGIDASYPGYHPSGYRLTGPIAWSDGNVSMRFAANAGPQNFTINEQKSSWDSSAVLENYVQPKVGSDYVPQTQNGLTVYTFENSAAWVNGGILYTIEGDAPLSNDQILRIATSL